MESKEKNSTDEMQETEVQVVVFKLGEEEYAIDILNVQEIIRLLNVTRIPRTDSHIEGVINLRGNIVPLINLHTKFGLKSAGDDNDKRIIVCQFDDIKAGIIVDEVLEVIRLSMAEIEKVDRVYSAISAEYVKGIAKYEGRLLILLDMMQILLGETVVQGG